MTSFSEIFQFTTVPILFKIGYLCLLFLYIIFTFVIFNQINSMDQLISEIHSSIIIKTVSLLVIFLGIMLFLAAVVIL